MNQIAASTYKGEGDGRLEAKRDRQEWVKEVMEEQAVMGGRKRGGGGVAAEWEECDGLYY